MTRSILSDSSTRGGQGFVQPVIDAVVAVAWSGHFAVLVGALAARELDYLLRTLERIVEFARLPRKGEGRREETHVEHFRRDLRRQSGCAEGRDDACRAEKSLRHHEARR